MPLPRCVCAVWASLCHVGLAVRSGRGARVPGVVVWALSARYKYPLTRRPSFGHAKAEKNLSFDFPWRFCPQRAESHEGHQFPNPRHRSRCARNTVGLVAKVEAQFASALIPDLIS